MNAINFTVGKRLRKARLDAGLTLADLADASGMTIDAISKRERGDVTISFADVINLAKAMKKDPKFFVQDLPQ